MARGQEEKRELLQEIIEHYGGEETDAGKVAVIPYKGYNIKIAFTVAKGTATTKTSKGAKATPAAPQVLFAPNEQEISDLRAYLDSME